MDLSSSSYGGFRSRRSYPTLNQVSLAPLTPRFPIDDDNDVEPKDYFSPRDDEEPHQHRTSYLSSYSVPGTPGVLSHSHSRSGSRVRHKSSSRTHLSDTNLQSQDASQPIHHNNGKKKRSVSSRRQSTDPAPHRRSDSEWLLRAGIALASSTREEKGQSWLVKRESSTSLVSEMNFDAGPNGRKGPSRRSRSGVSTPIATTSTHSRRGSRSLAASRRSSRPDLSMTSADFSHGANKNSNIPSPAGDAQNLVPDFVDERIRAEMASIQDEDEYGSSFSDDDLDDSEDEIDELELQRLTRERGFGLGSWIDRAVEWTLFGVDEWPSSFPSTVRFHNQPSYSDDRVLETEHASAKEDDASSVASIEDNDSIVHTENESLEVTEKPGEQGGWEDAGWLFRAVKRALYGAS